MELFNEITNVFRKVFQNPNLELTFHTSSKEIENWDSLHHMELINELENHFKININFQESMKINTVNEIYELVKNKKGN